MIVLAICIKYNFIFKWLNKYNLQRGEKVDHAIGGLSQTVDIKVGEIS